MFKYLTLIHRLLAQSRSKPQAPQLRADVAIEGNIARGMIVSQAGYCKMGNLWQPTE